MVSFNSNFFVLILNEDPIDTNICIESHFIIFVVDASTPEVTTEQQVKIGKSPNSNFELI